jgi:hypothetical protein
MNSRLSEVCYSHLGAETTDFRLVLNKHLAEPADKRQEQHVVSLFATSNNSLLRSLTLIPELASKPFTLEPSSDTVTVDTMGRKTGEPEYFAAREPNEDNVRAKLGPGYIEATLPNQIQPVSITD